MGGTVDKHEDVTSFPPGMTLSCVVVFFRHGARTPLTGLNAFDDHCFDPSLVDRLPPRMAVPTRVVGLDGQAHTPPPPMERLLPEGKAAGMLTPKGQEHAMGYGRWLRERYMRPLGMSVDRFLPHEVYLQAKNRQRTVDTMRCVLAGMYGTDGFHGNGGSLGNDVAVVIVAKHDDDFLDSDSKCVRRVKSTPPELQCQLPLPVFYRRLSPEVESSVAVETTTGDRLAELLLGEVRRCLTGAAANAETPGSGPKMFLFSCSDTTLSPLLSALGQGHVGRPEYLADVAFELHRDQDWNHWARVTYKGRTIIPLHLYSMTNRQNHHHHQQQQQQLTAGGQYVTRIHYIP